MTITISSHSSIITIPDTLRFWPWPRTCNPHYLACKKESSEWCESFKAFRPRAQKVFNKCDFNLLASLAYPLLDKAGCKIGCDLMNLFFVIDEHTDVADIETAEMQSNIIMDAIRNPHTPRPADEWIGGEMAQSFWKNAIKSVTPCSQRRFIDTFQLYMDSVVQQAIDRNTSHVRDVDSYFEVRRDTIGAKPSFVICATYMNLPDKVLDHPVIMRLSELCIDMLIIGNDLCSYKVENEKGDDGHNLVTIVMHQFNMDPQAAMMYISDLHDKLAIEFLEEWNNIPTFGGPLDVEVGTYCDGLGNWVRGNDSWSFESERYFGKHGHDVQVHRKIQLSSPRRL